MDYEIVTEGLAFPEGPVWLPDGSVVVVEIAGGCVTRVTPDGRRHVIAQTGGGPNGAALGPNETLFVCNNGGFEWHRVEGLTVPGHQPADYSGGRIEVVDVNTGKVERLYDSCDGRPLVGPNDLVFDNHGGFYFTDAGKIREDDADNGAVYYAKTDGSMIRRAAFPVNIPNGCGLSPDGKTLYVAQTLHRTLLSFAIAAPGEFIAETSLTSMFFAGSVVTTFPGRQALDSLAVAADGSVCVATLVERAGIATVDVKTGGISYREFPDLFTTNIAFGGDDMQNAWVTLSSSGRLLKTRWDRPGLKLAHYA
ncbi:Gluconolactonase [Sphingobium indicum BiD32]|uniref:Gluconolactonase n=1 Tax=Sphingobium indicum BiD32 TaxID=1301087 RepID=N1MS29_9SPHN|nr:SMP-30/gluconolactonase/LRE family protein [Sphingobium indicum]CCW19761.1 Gluconolactonase [Sphingobium indicum BiD32]